MVSNIVRIQLIDGPQLGYLDVKEDVSFPLNFAISDIRDVSSRTGSFSKTIKLAGTKNNNILLNNYFDVNIKSGTFNVNKIQKCAIIQNNVVIRDNYYLRLLKVVKTQNRGEEIDDLVEYEVQVRDSIGDFFKEIDNKELTELRGWGIYNHNYNVANVVDSFTHTVDDGYKYVLPWIGAPDAFNYDLNELLPGIYAKQIFDRIHQEAGYSYEWDALSAETVQFDKLILPYSGEKKKISEEDKLFNEVIAETTAIQSTNLMGGLNGVTQNIPWKHILTPNEIKDLQNYFDPSTSLYTNVFDIQQPNSLVYQVDIEYELVYRNSQAVPVTLNGGQINTISPKIKIFNQSGSLKATTNLTIALNTGSTSVNGMCQLSNGNTTVRFLGLGTTAWPVGDTIVGSANITTEVVVSNIAPGEVLRIGVDAIATQGAGNVWRLQGSFTAANMKAFLRVKSMNIRVVPNSDNGLIVNTPINLQNFLPKKVKQSEFLKSIYQMYNLYAEIDQQNPNKIIYFSRDNYYDSGLFKDWTNKLNKDQSQELYFVPEISSKKLILTYKDDDSDEFLKRYRGEVGETYAQVEVEFENENIRGVERKELTFSPTLNLPTDFKATLPLLAPDFNMNIRILLDGGLYPCEPYKIKQSASVEQTLTSYPYMGMIDKPTNAGFSIEYAQPDYYSYDPGILTQNNLYVNFWRRTLAQINSGKLLKAYFWLTEEDIFKLRLNDKIKINNSLWYINKVVDYNANDHKPTLVELLSVEDDLKLPRFGKIIKPVPPGFTTPIPFTPVKPLVPIKPVVFSLTEMIRKRTTATSVFNGGTDASNNMGVRNIITKDFVGVVIGNDKIIEDNGFYIDNTSIKSGEINIDNLAIINQNGLTVNGINYGVDGITLTERYIDDEYYESGYTVSTSSSTSFSYEETTDKVRYSIKSDFINLDLPAFADDTDAGSNGLNKGDLFQTDGTGSSPLNIPGIVMIKQ